MLGTVDSWYTSRTATLAIQDGPVVVIPHPVSSSRTFRAEQVRIVYVPSDNGTWDIWSAQVIGTAFRKDGTLGARRVSAMFFGENDTEAIPEWLRALVDYLHPREAAPTAPAEPFEWAAQE